MSGSARTTLISVSSIPLSRGALHFGMKRSSNGSSRSHRALEGSSFFILPRLATPALRLVVFGSLRPSVFYLFLRRSFSTTLRTQVRPAIEFVSGKEGLRPTFWLFGVLLYDVTGIRAPQVRLPGHPKLRKRPWPLRRSRGDGNGGRFVRSRCFLSWCSLHFYAVYQMLSL